MGPALSRLIHRWRIARQLAEAERNGQTLIAVDGWFAAPAQVVAFTVLAQQAADRWTGRLASTTPAEWQDATLTAAAEHLSPDDTQEATHGDQTSRYGSGETRQGPC